MLKIFLLVVTSLQVANGVNQYILDCRDFQIQHDRDFAHLAPNFNTMTETTMVGDFTLKTLIHIGDYSAVFTVYESPEILLKYGSNCQDTDSVNAVVADAWLSSYAKKLGVAPGVYHLSPPAQFPANRSSKLPFSLSDEQWNECHQRRGEVRYMVLRRLDGESVARYKGRLSTSVMRFDHAASILFETIAMIKTLHEKDLVHGDIHGGNVMLARDSNGATRLYLIDFGNAFFQDEILTNNPVYEIDQWTHPLTSVWQILGLSWGKRDDIYKALDMFARLINGPEFELFIQDLVDSGYQDLVSWRLNDFLFEIPSNSTRIGPNPFDHTLLNVSPETAIFMREQFVKILDIVRGLSDVNQPIPYVEIQNLIMDTLHAYNGVLLIAATTTTSTSVPSIEI